MSPKFCLLGLLLVAAVTAGPAGTRSKECASTCQDNHKFLYETGRKFEYQYEAETFMVVSGKEDSVTVKVSSTATIQPVNPCEYILSLSDVILHGAAESDEFANKVSRHPLRFAVQNGKVEHICGVDEEESWVINFKKAVISHFQNSMNDINEDEVLTETDVSGICETSYSSVNTGNDLIITRSKNPSECSHRPQIQQKLSSFGYSLDTLAQGISLLKSTQECKQIVANGIIKSVECEETHAFQPFQKYQSGTETKTKTSLKLVQVKVASSPFLESFGTRNEMLFELPEEEKKISPLEETETIMSELEILTKNGIKKQVPALFSDLVRSLRGLTHPQIQALYERSEPRLKQFLIDALPLVGTAESMGEFADLITRGDISEEDQDVWYTSLAFISHPTLNMFSAIEGLFENNVNNKGLLGVSSLVHNYCLKDTECTDKPEITKLLRMIESRLGLGCRATSDEEKENILYALKAIGNAGHFINAESILKRCYLEDNTMEIKIAAIDAWRRTPCDYNRNHLMSTYIDQYQDNEVRIASYLGLMKCPTQEIIDTIRDRLTSESVNQVESFVWTHLSNLQETASQEKQWIRKLIGEELLQKKFTTEALKMSRNFESSFFLKEQEFGATAESNVIFSGKSFVPRSSMFNLTIDLFGESINLFEMGGRMEGFESLIEKFFGSEGYYPEETLAAIVKNLRQDKSKEETVLEEYLAKEDDELKGSFYFKMFGNELFYKNFKGINDVFPEMSLSNMFDIIMDLVSKGNIDYTKNYDLVNSEFTFPTITGFPINLKLNGTATVGLKLAGNFNFEDLTSIDIQGKFEPSAAVRMDAAMTVNAYVLKSGVKLVSTLHSSTALEGKALVKGGNLADLTINVPEEDMEIFDMEYETFRIGSQGEIRVENPTKTSSYCKPILFKSLGVALCYENQIPTSGSDVLFPGPYRVHLSLKKIDSHSAYVFHYSNDPEKTLLLLNMPGSQSDKKWSASLAREGHGYEIDVHSPLGSVSGLFSYIYEKDEIGFESNVAINDERVYVAKFNFANKDDNEKKHIKAIALLECSEFKGGDLKFTANAIYDKETKSIAADMELAGPFVPAFTTNLTLSRKPEGKSLMFDLSSNALDVSLSGVLGEQSPKGLINLNGKYRLLNNEPKSLTTSIQYESNFMDEETHREDKYVTASVDVNEFNFQTEVELRLSDTSFKGKVAGNMGQVTWDVEHYGNYVVTPDTKELKIKQRLNIPSIGYNFLAEKHSTYTRGERLENEFRYTINNMGNEGHFLWNFGKNLRMNMKLVGGGEENPDLFNLEVSRLSEKSYSVQFSQVEPGHINRNFEGIFRYENSANEFEAKIKGSYNEKSFNEDSSVYEFNWDTAAKDSVFNSEASWICNGKKCLFRLNANPSTLSVFTNFPKEFSAEVKVEKEDEENRFLITSNLEDNLLEASGAISPKGLEGILKFKDQEFKILARLQDQGMELEAQISPTQRFSFHVNYALGRESSLDFGFETPIKGWEKQEARFSFTQGDSVQGEASITWRNTHHLNFVFFAKSDSRGLTRSFDANCRFTSTLVDFERVTFSVKNSMLRSTINTEVEGNWNNAVMKGNLDAFPLENGYKIDMHVVSPFTENILFSFEHKMSRQELLTAIDFTYGLQKSKMFIKGEMINYKNLAVNFTLSSPFLPQIHSSLKLEANDTTQTIEFKGNYNKKNVLLLGNCKTYMKDQERICNLGLRLETFFSKPFVVNFTKKINNENEFESDIEITSDFISSESIKGHIEGKVLSKTLTFMKGYVSGRDISGRMSLNHEISNNILKTEFNLEFNSFKTSIKLGGTVDLVNKVASLHGEVESTSKAIDGYKMTAQHTSQGETRETYFNLSKDDFTPLKVYHSFTYKSLGNWSTNLNINDIFTMKSETNSSDSELTHTSNVKLYKENIIFSFEYRNRDQLEIKSSLDSPWTSLISATLNHEKKEARRTSSLKIEYDNGKSLLLESEYEFDRLTKYISLSIHNRDWDLKSLSMELKATNSDEKSLDFTLRFNNMLTTDLKFFQKDNTRGGNIIFKFNNEQNPISLTGKFSYAPDQFQTFVEFSSKEKHSLDLKFIGTMTSGTVYVTSVLPVFFNEPLKTSIAFNKEMPIRIQIINNLENKKYMVETLLDANKFVIRSSTPTTEGELNVNWLLNEFKKTFTLEFKSPFDFVKDTTIRMNSNSQYSNNINIELEYDTHKIVVEGTLNSHLIEINSKSTLTGFENINMKIEMKDSEIEGQLTRNDDVAKFVCKGNFGTSNGEGELHFILPGDTRVNNIAYVSYSLSDSNVNIILESNIMSETFKFNVRIDVEELPRWKILLDVKSPWKNMDNIMIEATIEKLGMEINGKLNEINFESSTRFNFEENNKASIKINLNSNVPDFRVFTMNSEINMSQKPYFVLFDIKKENESREFFISFDINNNNIELEFRSPIKSFQNIKITGNYKFEGQKQSLSFLLDNNRNLYNLYGSIDLSELIPKIELNISTPLEGREIELNLSGNLKQEASISFFLRTGKQYYKIKASNQLSKTRGNSYLEISFPMEGINNIKMKLSYDLENENKFATIDLERDEFKERFSVEGKFMENELTFGIETPIEGYERFVISGKYDKTRNDFSAQGNIIMNDQTKLRFEGRATVKDDGYEFESVIPYYDSLKITGKITNEKVIININNGYKAKEICIKYALADKNSFIIMTTPFEYISYFAIGYKFDAVEGAIDSNLYFQRNSNRFEIAGVFQHSPKKMNMDLNLENSLTNSKYTLKAHYDLVSKKKMIGLLLGNGSEIQKYLIEGFYEGRQHGYIKLYTPFSGYSSSGFEYKFKYNDIDITDTELFVTLTKDSQDITLGIQSYFNKNEMIFKLKTPFTNYETFGIEGKINYENKEGETTIYVGSYIVSFELNMKPDNFVLHIETPFNGFQLFKISSKYGWTISKKFIILEFFCNDIRYELNGNVVLSQTNPQINFRFVSPLQIMSILEINGSFDLNDRSELLDFNINYNSTKYCLSFGYEYDYLKASWKLNIISPIQGFEVVKTDGNVDLYSTTKVFSFSYGNNNSSKTIYLSGSLTDDDIGFAIEAPFDVVRNLKTRGSLNRSKRSIEFEMMNDQQAGKVIANFNSLVVKATTPFEKAKDISFDLKKTNKGKWILNYKRNNNMAFINFSAEPKKKDIQITINSELPGWEYLALAGRIDAEEVLAYISGQRNSTMVKLSGTGTLGSKSGSLAIEITSSLDNYKKVLINLDYNSKRNVFTFNCRSESSDFKILIEFKRKLHIDIFVPNPEENTIVKGNLTAFKGDLSLSSRFPKFRTFSINYGLKLGPVIEAKATIERNTVKIFELELERDGAQRTLHLMIHGRRGKNHSMFHYHAAAWKEYEFVFNRNGKEFKANMKGSGSLPVKGKFDYTITNSFREIPRTVTGKIDVDRSSSPKQITLDVNWHDGGFYSSVLKYNFDLSTFNTGDFVLRTTTPDRSMARWKDIEGNWNFNTVGKGSAFLRVGNIEYNLKGQLGIKQGDLTLDTNRYGNKYILTWRFIKNNNSRDYFLKVGKIDRFVMFKLKGTLNTIFNGDVSGAFRISRFMQNEFNFTAKWTRSAEGLSGGGSFSIGKYSGTHTLTNFKRNPVERSSTFHWEATTNIDGFRKITLHGEYSIARRMVNVKLSWDTDEISIVGSLDNMAKLKSENTVNFHLPAFGDGQITFSHDFTNPLQRSIKITGNIGPKPLSYNINWTKNKNLTVFNLEANADSPLFGKIYVHSDFDITNLKNAKGSFEYKRNNDKYLTIKWSRIKTKTSVVDDLMLTSHLKVIPTGKIYFNADWRSGFNMNSGIKWGTKEIKATFVVGPGKTTASITTPFSKFGDIDVQIDYDIKAVKSKVVNFQYTRGDKVIKMNFNSKIASKKTGSLTFSITSPFKVLKTLTFNANWKKGKFSAVYKRNDITVNFNGVAEVKFDKSSFNLQFTPPNKKPIQIEFSYDLESFIKGIENVPKDLIKVKLNIDNQLVEFTSNGFRTQEKIFLEISGTTTLGTFNTFYLKLDSELNLNKREGQFEIKVDDFHYHVKNTFEKRPKGMYAKTQVHSSLTSLSGLTFGFGKDGDSFIVTTGFGDEREISFTIKGRDGFKSGFYGVIDIPRRGIFGLEYSVNYSFKSADRLKVNLKIAVAEGKNIEAEMIYDSDGVMGRLTSPWLGYHSARMRRSISDDHFLADVGINQYGFTLEGDYKKELLRKGFKIGGEIFGQKVLLDSFININSFSDSEGKLIIETPFKNFERFGGSFKIKQNNQQVYGNIDFDFLHHFSLNVDLDLMNKIKGDVVMTMDSLVYEAKCDFSANEGNIMRGNLIIKTPHTSFERVVVDGTINSMSFKDFQAKFTLNYPSGSYDVNVSFKADSPVYSMNINFDTDQNKSFRFNATYLLTRNPFYLKGNTSVFVDEETIFSSNSELSFKGKEDITTTYEVNYKENYTGSLNILANKEHITVGLMMNTLDQKSVELNANISKSMKQISLEAKFKGYKTYIILFQHKEEGDVKKSVVEINLPYAIEGYLELNISKYSPASFTARIETQGDIKKLILSKESFIQSNGTVKTKLITDMEMFFPFFEPRCKTYAEFLIAQSSIESKIKIAWGAKTLHTLYMQLDKMEDLYNLHFNIDSTAFEGENGININMTCDLKDLVKLSVESIIMKYVNNIYFDLTHDYKLLVNCISPFIPTGMAKLEGSLISSNLVKDTQFQMNVANAHETLSAEGKFMWDEENKTQLFLEIRTPFEGYKKTEFGFDFTRGDITSVSIHMSPFKLEAEAHFGIESSIFNAGIKLQTGDGKENISQIEAMVPLNHFAPKFSASFDGRSYELGARFENSEIKKELHISSINIHFPEEFGIMFKSKAPYELDYEYTSHQKSCKFGVIFDSSFLTLLDDTYLFLI